MILPKTYFLENIENNLLTVNFDEAFCFICLLAGGSVRYDNAHYETRLCKIYLISTKNLITTMDLQMVKETSFT